ncbi:MAG: 50S ribosomal protein L15 [Desulfobacteraceae bacterium]|nr:50S ribosomal protein L15 [Desulfobacteraceae bacterium]MCF8093872.1 50S ribosomal protein L15 [Desulfobacteraceae bacterium]
MRLHELSPEKGAKKSKKRVGRGVASGQGKTAGRGTKGLNARSGGGVRPGYEGGQMPLQRRLPKRGFRNLFKKEFSIVNIRDLNRFEAGSRVDGEALRAAGIVKDRDKPVKLLGQGELGVSVEVKVAAVSRSAREKVQAAGGKVEVA